MCCSLCTGTVVWINCRACWNRSGGEAAPPAPGEALRSADRWAAGKGLGGASALAVRARDSPRFRGPRELREPLRGRRRSAAVVQSDVGQEQRKERDMRWTQWRPWVVMP